jgi:hypothetical protein
MIFFFDLQFYVDRARRQWCDFIDLQFYASTWQDKQERSPIMQTVIGSSGIRSRGHEEGRGKFGGQGSIKLLNKLLL